METYLTAHLYLGTVTMSGCPISPRTEARIRTHAWGSKGPRAHVASLYVWHTHTHTHFCRHLQLDIVWWKVCTYVHVPINSWMPFGILRDAYLQLKHRKNFLLVISTSQRNRPWQHNKMLFIRQFHNLRSWLPWVNFPSLFVLNCQSLRPTLILLMDIRTHSEKN